jgi:hypothetical protein
MVDRSLEEVFFKPRPNPKYASYYNAGEPATIPPLLHELVKEVMEANVQAAVREWIGSNQEEVNATIQKVIQEGIGAAVLGAMNSMFNYQLSNLQNNISQQISNYR